MIVVVVGVRERHDALNLQELSHDLKASDLSARMRYVEGLDSDRTSESLGWMRRCISLMGEMELPERKCGGLTARGTPEVCKCAECSRDIVLAFNLSILSGRGW